MHRAGWFISNAIMYKFTGIQSVLNLDPEDSAHNLKIRPHWDNHYRYYYFSTKATTLVESFVWQRHADLVLISKITVFIIKRLPEFTEESITLRQLYSLRIGYLSFHRSRGKCVILITVVCILSDSSMKVTGSKFTHTLERQSGCSSLISISKDLSEDIWNTFQHERFLMQNRYFRDDCSREWLSAALQNISVSVNRYRINVMTHWIKKLKEFLNIYVWMKDFQGIKFWSQSVLLHADWEIRLWVQSEWD